MCTARVEDRESNRVRVRFILSITVYHTASHVLPLCYASHVGKTTVCEWWKNGITTAVVNNMPLIQYMALIQFNATLDINYGSKQRMCTH